MNQKLSSFLIFSLSFSAVSAPFAGDSPPPIIAGVKARPKPQIPLNDADVIIDWQNILDDCSLEKICVQGGLYNRGIQPAKNVQLRVDVGSHTLSKPRLTKYFKPDTTTMNPGDRQEYYFELDRKTPYKNRKGENKLLEIGKYNFKVTPIWASNKPQSTPPKRK